MNPLLERWTPSQYAAWLRNTGRDDVPSLAKHTPPIAASRRFLCYPPPMTKVDNIEKAVAELPPKELAAFRAWFEAFAAAQFDEAIERRAADGNLDRLAEEAMANYREGRARAL